MTSLTADPVSVVQPVTPSLLSDPIAALTQISIVVVGTVQVGESVSDIILQDKSTAELLVAVVINPSGPLDGRVLGVSSNRPADTGSRVAAGCVGHQAHLFLTSPLVDKERHNRSCGD